jgi:multidrug efflux pump subunit AcrB
MWIVRLALSRPYTFVVVALLIAVLGAVSIYRMSTDIFPEIDIPVISVVWQYAGMPADELETRVVLVNERVLTASVNDIEHIESQSLYGVAVIRIYFHPGANVSEAEAQVTATSQAILKSMPPGIDPPYIVRYSTTSVPIVQISVSSDTMTEAELNDYATNFVIQRLGTIEGARVPQPWGGTVRQVMVDLDLERLYAHNLSPQDVAAALANQNLIVPTGTAKIGPTEYIVRLNSSPELVEAFNSMPVKSVGGIPIYISDVAYVRDGYAVQTNVVRRDGRRAVLMTVLKGEGASTLSVVKRLREIMPRIQAQVPRELKLEFLFDQSVFVRAAVEGVLKEGAVAAGLTALMILLFLGSWRSTLIVATSIPLSILSSITVLWALGHSLNTMTLGGLALAVGILVDDATVEIENIHRNMAMKKPLRTAILDAASQIATPAFVATLSICIVFVPVVFLTGPAAYLFTPLALAVVFAMLTSYFLSRTLVPTMVNYMLGAEAEAEMGGEKNSSPGESYTLRSLLRHPSRLHEVFNAGFERLRLAYHGLLDFALDHRPMALAMLLGFALGSLALYPHIGLDFFPSVDAGQFCMHVRAPTGTRVEETERIFGQAEKVIREIVPKHDLEMILDNMGLTQWFTIMAYVDNGTVSEADGEILVSLKPNHAPTADYVARLRRELPKRFPECTFYFKPADITSQILNFGLPAPIDVQVVGIDRTGNLAIAQKLQQKMARIPGAVDVRLHQMTDSPNLHLEVDRIMASQVGLTQQNVTGSILVSLSSTSQVAPNYWVNPVNRVNYRVAVQTPPHRVDSVETLMNTPIINGITPASNNFQMIESERRQSPPQLINNLVNLRRDISPANISHYDVQPVFDVFANVQGRDLAAVAGDVQRIIDSIRPEMPRGSSIVMRGQAQTMMSSFIGLATGLGFAVLLVYLLMVVNFQSWLDPLIILTALPGALAGILWMLFVTQTTLSVPALMGTIMCVGVAMSNSILLITFANDQRRSGYDARSAALSAGATRLRPVMMTALAMTIGMLPMSLGLGEGGEQNAPLGRAVIGGLLMATVYTLFFVPLMYSLLRQKPPAPEEAGEARIAGQLAERQTAIEPRR